MNITIRLTKVEYEMLKELQKKAKGIRRDWGKRSEVN